MRKFFIPLIVFSLIWISCNDENALFEIGNDDVDVRTRMAMIDTFTVKSYTVKWDSLALSRGIVGTPLILTGSLTDDLFGTVTASSFFRLNLPVGNRSSNEIDDDAIFDSISFFMIYNGYYEGDTTAPFTIHLHQLKERIKPDAEGYFFNEDSIPAFPEPLGSYTFRPSPNSRDTVYIPVDPDLGKDFFAKLRDEANQFTENALFYEYFKGVMLRGDENNKAILSFKYPSDTTFQVGFRIFYHYFDFNRINKRIDFLASALSSVQEGSVRLQYNRLILSSPEVAYPSTRSLKLPVSLTNNRSYVLSGVGVLTRIEIPYLKNINHLGENIRILSAELMVEPVAGTYTKRSLPTKITLNETTNSNQWGAAIRDRNNQPLIAQLNIDMLNQENTRYTFDITNFIISRYQKETEVIPAMLLHVYGDDFYQSVKRLVLGSQHHRENKIKLKVYYINVN